MYSRRTRDYSEGLLMTRIQTDRLIELYKADVGLWDLSSPIYHNKDKRKKALQKILDIMKAEFDGFDGTVDQLQYKLSNLRGYYSRELSKIRKSQQNPTEDAYISSWRLFEPLDSFLRAQITPRKHPSNQEVTCKTQQEYYDSDEEMFLVSDDSEELSSISLHGKHTPNNSVSLTNSNAQVHPGLTKSFDIEAVDNEHKIENINRIKRTKNSASRNVTIATESPALENESRMNIKKARLSVSHDQEVRETENVPKVNDVKVDLNKTDSNEDDDSLFARYIATELRKIKDPRTKLYVKFKIHSVIYESQFGGNPPP